MSAGRVLVTGGAGFIGSHVVERLLALGTDVAVVDDLSRGDAGWLPEDVVLHRADVCAAETLRQIVVSFRPTAVVHLAAVHFVPEVDGTPERARHVNVGGTNALLAALAAAPPEMILFASTGAVYPDRRGPIPESCPVGPLDLYGRTKVEGESAVERFAAEHDTRHVVARLFNVIGARETNPHVVPELVGQLRGGAKTVRLGALDPIRDYTDVLDIATALIRLVDAQEDRRTPVVNVGSGKGTSVRDLVAISERVLGYQIAVQVDGSRRRARDRAELVADIGIARALGWAPTRTVEDTLRTLLAGTGESSAPRTDGAT